MAAVFDKEPEPMTTSKHGAHAAALFVITCWGTTLVASKHLLTVYTPIQIIILRFLLAIIALVILRPRFQRLPWRDELRCAALGFFGCTLYFLAENTALTYTLAANVSIIVAAAPILTALLAHFTTRDEQLNRNLFIGFAIAFAGVALTVFNGTVVLQLNPWGDLLSLIAALCWAAYAIFLKDLLARYDDLLITRRTMVYGLVTSLPFLLWEGDPFPIKALADPALLVCLLFLGLVGSALCYVLWSGVSRQLGIVVTNNYIYGIPFVTMIAAALFLEEPVSLMGFIGAVLIILGVVVSDRR